MLVRKLCRSLQWAMLLLEKLRNSIVCAAVAAATAAVPTRKHDWNSAAA